MYSTLLNTIYLFVVHYKDGIRFVSGTERVYERGSSRALHLRRREKNREQVQTQGVLHLHLKQRLWIKCLGWQMSGVIFPGILPGSARGETFCQGS